MKFKNIIIFRQISAVINLIFGLGTSIIILVFILEDGWRDPDDVISFIILIVFLLSCLPPLLLYLSHLLKEKKASINKNHFSDILDDFDIENGTKTLIKWRRKFEPLLFWSIISAIIHIIAGSAILLMILKNLLNSREFYLPLGIAVFLIIDGLSISFYAMNYKTNVNNITIY